jgi:hypothetical protein
LSDFVDTDSVKGCQHNMRHMRVRSEPLCYLLGRVIGEVVAVFRYVAIKVLRVI